VAFLTRNPLTRNLSDSGRWPTKDRSSKIVYWMVPRASPTVIAIQAAALEIH